MDGRHHTYTCSLTWTGNRGAGMASYKAYSRDHVLKGAGKPDLLGSSDPAFRGDASRYNPEEMLVASLASCHMLWYLHLCADAGVTIAKGGEAAKARALHESAHQKCFIANSVNFPVGCEPEISVSQTPLADRG